MIRKVDVGSVFGTAQRTSYEYMKLLNEKTNGNFRTLVVDDKDGLHSLPFATHGSKVVMYEPNEVYIKGGVIDDITITPITNRKYFKEKVYNTIIPRLIRLTEAPSHGKPIVAYDPKSRGSEAYLNLAKEVIKANE